MRVLALLVVLFVSAAPFARAADAVVAGQSVIRQQEEAMSRDDAAAAYAFASPIIQAIFGDAETFMGMVRRGYAPVYRHRSFTFGAARRQDDTIMQDVDIVDADGVAWLATYSLEPQPDGSLKISACVLSKLTGA